MRPNVSLEDKAEMRERRARGESIAEIAAEMGWGETAVQQAVVGVLPKWGQNAARIGLRNWQDACPTCGQPKSRQGSLCRKCQLETHPSTGRPAKPRFAKAVAVQMPATATPLAPNASQTTCAHKHQRLDSANHSVCLDCGAEWDIVPQFYYGHTYGQKEEEGIYA